MKQKANENGATPILFPMEPEQYWQRMRMMIREEIGQVEKPDPVVPMFETPGLTYKPLYKITEVCQLFQVTKPTVYDWCKHGKLKPLKIRSRVFFLWQDIQELMKQPTPETPAK